MASPFHASLDTPLLDIGGEVWDIRAACTAVSIIGAAGSGKSSGSAKATRKAYLRSGMGGTFLVAKIDEADDLITDIRAAGRESDLVVIDESGAHRFNVLDYAARTLGGPGFESNIVEVMRRMSEATKVANPKAATSGGGDGKYFEEGAEKWLSNAFPLLLLAEGTIRLADVNRFIATLPNSPADTDGKSPAWQSWSQGYCAQVHQRAYQAASQPGADPNAIRIINQHGTFFLTEIPVLDNRPRSSIASTLTNLIYPFLSGKLAELFTTDTTITPDDCRAGKIVVLDLSPIRYGSAGLIAQSLWKYLFGFASRANYTEGCRPVFLYADEAQNFLASTDADLLAEARSAKICTCFISQDIATFESKLGATDAERLLGMFGTRIFHANNSRKTNLEAAELIYKVQKFHVGENTSIADNVGGGGNLHDKGSAYHGQKGKAKTRGQSSSGYLDYEIPPDYFATQLRTGTARNNYKVDGIVIRTGQNWRRTGRHWVKAEFDQRA